MLEFVGLNCEACQQQRIASGTPQVSEARCQHDRERHRQQSLFSFSQSLPQQPLVHSKMSKFHFGMAALQVSTCITCMERFPGMTVTVTSAGTQCVYTCTLHRDKHNPKAYSSDNNMHPCPVPATASGVAQMLSTGPPTMHMCALQANVKLAHCKFKGCIFSANFLSIQ